MTEPGTYIASEKPLFVLIGRCGPCNRPVRTTADVFSGDHYPVACPDCGKFTDCQRLFGVIRKMSCDSRCESAYGPHCGGANHAGVWSQPGEMLADALAFYRADRERRAAAAEKSRATRQRKKDAEKAAAFVIWLGEYRELFTELTGTDWLTHQYPNGFLADMRDIVEQGELLSEPQAQRSIEILARRREVAERVAAEQAERAARDADRPEQIEVPVTRDFFEGKITEARIYTGDFATVWKVKVDCGPFNVYGTLPRNLTTEALPQSYSAEDFRNLGNALRGRYVRIKGNMKPTGKKTGDGYFDRPSNGEFLPEPAPEPAVT